MCFITSNSSVADKQTALALADIDPFRSLCGLQSLIHIIFIKLCYSTCDATEMFKHSKAEQTNILSSECSKVVHFNIFETKCVVFIVANICHGFNVCILWKFNQIPIPMSCIYIFVCNKSLNCSITVVKDFPGWISFHQVALCVRCDSQEFQSQHDSHAKFMMMLLDVSY